MPIEPMHQIEVDDAARAEGIDEHDGYSGCFTRNQYPGAIPNGSRIKKVICETGDTSPLGSEGVVLGSIGAGPLVGYFVEWDANPKLAVFVAGPKIMAA